GKPAGGLLAHRSEPDLLERRVDLGGDLREARGGPEGMQEAVAGLCRDPQVVGDAEVGKHALDLHGALDAAAADLVRLECGDVAPGEEYAARSGRPHARDDVEECRLAGAVGADDGVHPAGLEGEIDAVDRDQAAEALGQPLGAQDRLAHEVTRFMSPRQRPTNPFGAKITIRIAITPTISRWCCHCVDTTSRTRMKMPVPTSGPKGVPVPPQIDQSTASPTTW